MDIAQDVIGFTFVIYILLMLAIGWAAYRKTHNLSDYILGGRKLGPWVTALSAGASDMSGWLLLGLPGYAYASGFEAFWIAAGLLIGTWLNWKIVARRLRVYSEIAGDALTLPAFFEHRFADKSRMLRLISAFFILLFFLFYTASGLVAGGKLFNTVFGLPYEWAVAAGAAVIIAYTFVGGFLAVSWTDLVQGLLMAAALVIVPVMVINHADGWSSTLTAIQQNNPHLMSFFQDSSGNPLGLIAILSLLGWGLGYFGQPHILARFKAVRVSSDISAARRIAVSWTAITLLGAVLVGMSGIAYLDTSLTGSDSEKVFMLLVTSLFHPVVAGILLAAILAAVMSTADSQLLVSSAALTEDFYKAVFRQDAQQTELVMVGRSAVVLIAVIAFLLAMDSDSKVLDLVAYAWAGFGAAFGPALILAIYWPRMNRHGALAGVISGGVTVVIWKHLSGGLFELYELVPGFILSSCAIVLVSLLTKPPADSIIQRHREMTKQLTGGN